MLKRVIIYVRDRSALTLAFHTKLLKIVALSGSRFDHRREFLFLLTQVVLVGFGLFVSGLMTPVPQPDTPTYTNYSFLPVSDALSRSRTPGYPLFLQACRLMSPTVWAATRTGSIGEWAAVPYLQFLVHAAAISIFWLGLKTVVRDSRWRTYIASVLLYSSMFFRHVSLLIGDSLASSLSIAGVGLLLIAIRPRAPRHVWASLMVVVAAAWIVRPAYLFLTVLIPALGIALAWLRTGPQRFRQVWKPLGVRLAACSLGPILTYCLARLILVGQFGIVSFGGINIVGVVGQYMTPDVAAALPNDLQSLAQRAMSRRRQITRHPWDPSSYTAMENAYDLTMWQIYVPAAKALYGDDPRVVNNRLRHFGTAVIRIRSRQYMTWLIKAFRRGVGMIAMEFAIHPLNLIVVVLIAFLIVRSPPRRQNRNGYRTIEDSLRPLVTISVSFAVAKLLLVVALAPAIARFTDACAVFFPCVAVTVLGSVAQSRRPQV